MKNKEQLIADYAHDFRYTEMSEESLAETLTSFANELAKELIDDIAAFNKIADSSHNTRQRIKFLQGRLTAHWLGEQSND